jgi:hypothetical protein
MDTLPARTARHPHAGRWAGMGWAAPGALGDWGALGWALGSDGLGCAGGAGGTGGALGWALGSDGLGCAGGAGGTGGTGLGAVPIPEPVA